MSFPYNSTRSTHATKQELRTGFEASISLMEMARTRSSSSCSRWACSLRACSRRSSSCIDCKDFFFVCNQIFHYHHHFHINEHKYERPHKEPRNLRHKEYYYLSEIEWTTNQKRLHKNAHTHTHTHTHSPLGKGRDQRMTTVRRRQSQQRRQGRLLRHLGGRHSSARTRAPPFPSHTWATAVSNGCGCMRFVCFCLSISVSVSVCMVWLGEEEVGWL